jgi:uroporphyrin-III C-methyltransferase
LNDPVPPDSTPAAALDPVSRVASIDAPTTAAAPQPAVATHTLGRWIAAGAVLLAALSAAALTLAWNTQQRLKSAEFELVKRQQDAGGQAAEARTLARQADATVRESAAKIALLEARVAETSLQRTQLEELIQSLSRSRDENVLADVDAAIRVAMQQAAITGSVEPLIAALRQADERLARYQQPRLERVRRAVAQDLDRARAAGVVDLPSLTIRLDEAIRSIDDLPVLAAVDRRPPRRDSAIASAPTGAATHAATGAGAAATAAQAASQAAAAPAWGWPRWLDEGARGLLEHLWGEVRSLVRVTRIEYPDAALLAPEQVFFVRENLKLRLLNARLALMSRQFDQAQSDLREAMTTIDRYFDRSSKRVLTTGEVLRQTAAQARQVSLPRPDATLAAVAAAVAGR